MMVDDVGGERKQVEEETGGGGIIYPVAEGTQAWQRIREVVPARALNSKLVDDEVAPISTKFTPLGVVDKHLLTTAAIEVIVRTTRKRPMYLLLREVMTFWRCERVDVC